MLLITLAFNLLLTWVLIDRKQQIERVKLESIARSQRDNLQNDLLRLVFKTETLNALVIDKSGSIQEFERVAAALRDEDTIQAFVLAPGGTIDKVYPYTPANSLLVGRDMLDGNLGCHEAITARHGAPLTLAGPVLLPNGDAALVGRLSIFLPDTSGRPQYWGIAAILLRFPDVLNASDLYLLDSMTGPLPTPAISFLTRSMRADLGVVISASHNPFHDNGIKFFDADGYKLPDLTEDEISAMVLDSDYKWPYPEARGVGRATKIEDAGGRYIVYTKSCFPPQLTLSGLRIVVDCANGASYKVAPLALEELGAEVFRIGTSPDGTNINEHCGSLYPEVVAAKVREVRADVGLALDGDADRLIVVDEHGDIIDGDQLMAMAIKSWRSRWVPIVKVVVKRAWYACWCRKPARL